MSAPTAVYALAPRFVHDHWQRDLPEAAGAVSRLDRETRRATFVELDRVGYYELLADADYYATEMGQAGFDDHGLIASARAVARMLRQAGPPPLLEVVAVWLAFSNHGGATSILLAVPAGTDRETLDDAALIRMIATTVSTPALWRPTGGGCSYQPSTIGEYDPATWGERGRGRLLGRPFTLDEAEALRPRAIERLEAVRRNTVIYDADVRRKAEKLIERLGSRP